MMTLLNIDKSYIFKYKIYNRKNEIFKILKRRELIMKIINTGNDVYEVYADSLRVHDKLPAQTYKVCFSRFSGFFLKKTKDLIANEEKIYGNHHEKLKKVMRTFDSFERNLGIILSGKKGIGKTLFARLLSEEVIKQGYPFIMVNEYIPGIADFLKSIEQEVVVFFDEFDKTFGDIKPSDGDPDPQSTMLGLFDGVSNGKKMFVITCNNLNKLNDYLVNRPGRFHYHFRFTCPNQKEIKEYLMDKVVEKYWDEIEKVVTFSRKIELNYDCLRAIAFELNHGENFENAIADLNIVNV